MPPVLTPAADQSLQRAGYPQRLHHPARAHRNRNRPAQCLPTFLHASVFSPPQTWSTIWIVVPVRQSAQRYPRTSRRSDCLHGAVWTNRRPVLAMRPLTALASDTDSLRPQKSRAAAQKFGLSASQMSERPQCPRIVTRRHRVRGGGFCCLEIPIAAAKCSSSVPCAALARTPRQQTGRGARHRIWKACLLANCKKAPTAGSVGRAGGAQILHPRLPKRTCVSKWMSRSHIPKQGGNAGPLRQYHPFRCSRSRPQSRYRCWSGQVSCAHAPTKLVTKNTAGRWQSRDVSIIYPPPWSRLAQRIGGRCPANLLPQI